MPDGDAEEHRAKPVCAGERTQMPKSTGLSPSVLRRARKAAVPQPWSKQLEPKDHQRDASRLSPKPSAYGQTQAHTQPKPQPNGQNGATDTGTHANRVRVRVRVCVCIRALKWGLVPGAWAWDLGLWPVPVAETQAQRQESS